MYNEDLKYRYISQLDKIYKPRAEALFERLQSAENDADKDVGEMEKREVINIIERYGICLYISIRLPIWIINDYRRWYSEGSLERIDVREIDLSSEVKTHLFRDEDELSVALMPMPIDQGYFIPPISYLLWLGLEIEEILNLKNSDVSEVENGFCIRCGNDILVTSSKKIVSVLKEYINVKYIQRTYRSRYVAPDETVYFIKNYVVNKPKSPQERVEQGVVKKKFSLYNAKHPELTKNLTITSISYSGKLFRMREAERAGVSFGKDYFRNVLHIPNERDYQDMLLTFEAYKKAFPSN